jgi:hypothetical protein
VAAGWRLHMRVFGWDVMSPAEGDSFPKEQVSSGTKMGPRARVCLCGAAVGRNWRGYIFSAARCMGETAENISDNIKTYQRHGRSSPRQLAHAGAAAGAIGQTPALCSSTTTQGSVHDVIALAN